MAPVPFFLEALMEEVCECGHLDSEHLSGGGSSSCTHPDCTCRQFIWDPDALPMQETE